jgi:CheY-like chemotaxis protein
MGTLVVHSDMHTMSTGGGRGPEYVTPTIGLSRRKRGLRRPPRCETEAVPPAPRAQDRRVAIRILLIEDDVRVADLLALAFEEAGHEMSTSYSGEEGLRYLEGTLPDALFLDVMLPKMSGIEVLRVIRQRYPMLPVVLVTGLATDRDMNEARSLGVVDIIQKPDLLAGFSQALARISRERGQP